MVEVVVIAVVLLLRSGASAGRDNTATLVTLGLPVHLPASLPQ